MFRPPNIYRRRNDLFIFNQSSTDRDPNQQQEISKTNYSNILSEFCAKSTIHGIAYLGNRTRHLIERIWWTISIALAMVFCVLWIYDAWYTNQTIVLRLEKNPRLVNTIPFPVVDICPSAKTSTQKFNYTNVYRSLLKLDGANSRTVTPNETYQMRVVSQLCENGKAFENISKFYSDDEYNDDGLEIFEMIMSLGVDFNETFVMCKFFDKEINCRDIFTPLVSEKGLCYAFNTLNIQDFMTNELFFDLRAIGLTSHPSNWNLDKGYKTDRKDQESYPFRMDGAGEFFGITAILKINDDNIDRTCSGPSQCFDVMFHTPVELPHMKKGPHQLDLGMASTFAIEPKYIETDPEVRKYAPHIRNCYFNLERKLRFFKQYSQSSCKLECLSNYTLMYCGCVHFSLPRAKDAMACGLAKLDCYYDRESRFYRANYMTSCNCLPSCVSISYDVYSTSTKYDFVGAYSKSTYHKEYDFNNAKFSLLSVSFHDERFYFKKRVVNRYWSDWLAIVGGLLGLCLGASILSFVELFYYLTLHPFMNYRNEKKALRQPEPDQPNVFTFSP